MGHRSAIARLIGSPVALTFALAAVAAKPHYPDILTDNTRLDIESVNVLVDTRRDDPVIGLWQLTAEGGEIAIIPDDNTASLLIVAIDSPDRSILPGTVIGIATPSAVATDYDATLLVSPGVSSGHHAVKSRHATLRLTDPCRLSFIDTRRGVTINPWRLIPYMFRGLVSPVDNRPDNHNGAIRIGASHSGRLATPRVL